jgi:hypothetical protein
MHNPDKSTFSNFLPPNLSPRWKTIIHMAFVTFTKDGAMDFDGMFLNVLKDDVAADSLALTDTVTPVSETSTKSVAASGTKRRLDALMEMSEKRFKFAEEQVKVESARYDAAAEMEGKKLAVLEKFLCATTSGANDGTNSEIATLREEINHKFDAMMNMMMQMAGSQTSSS